MQRTWLANLAFQNSILPSFSCSWHPPQVNSRLDGLDSGRFSCNYSYDLIFLIFLKQGTRHINAIFSSVRRLKYKLFQKPLTILQKLHRDTVNGNNLRQAHLRQPITSNQLDLHLRPITTQNGANTHLARHKPTMPPKDSQILPPMLAADYSSNSLRQVASCLPRASLANNSSKPNNSKAPFQDQDRL